MTNEKRYRIRGYLRGLRICLCPNCRDGGKHECYLEYLNCEVKAKSPEHARQIREDYAREKRHHIAWFEWIADVVEEIDEEAA
jgi:hypothetical protein